MLVGGLFKGAFEHVAMKAGGSEQCQLLVAEKGVATSSEKYLITHSAHTSVKFLAAAWNILKAYPEAPSVATSKPGKHQKPEDNQHGYNDSVPDWNAN